MADLANLKELSKLLRYDILTSTTAAGSGHPTSSLSGVELMTSLFFNGHFHVHFEDSKNIVNDRIIFSKGHAAPLLYAMYHAAGVVSYDELLTLRQMGSKLEGHPTPEFEQIEVSTGSLGQGLSIGAGMAVGMKMHAKKETISGDRIPRIYVLLGDSEVAEGQIWEAMEIASHYELNNLIGILDVNRLGQRGTTMLEWDLETYEKRISAFGWETIIVENGNDIEQTNAAFAQVEELSKSSKKPIMIIAKTEKGAGISFLANKDDWHGKALPQAQLEEALKELGDVDTHLRGEVVKPQVQAKNNDVTKISIESMPEMSGKIATREAYGTALEQLGKMSDNVVVLDAETSNSTYAEKFKKDFSDRFLEMYIAEQNMASMALGLSKVGFIPFASSFAAFLTRAFDQIRMAQYAYGNVKIVGSHAGVSIGVDGSSQMALEDLAMMRSILDSIVLYPSDAISTLKLSEKLMDHQGISYLRLTREKTPILYSSHDDFNIGGSKVVKSSNEDQVTLIAAGITVHESIKAYEMLKSEGINVSVIDAYSVKPLDVPTITDHASKTGKIVVVEDHYPYGGLGEAVKVALTEIPVKIIHLAVNKIPHSGQPDELLRYAEIDAEAITQAVKKLI